MNPREILSRWRAAWVASAVQDQKERHARTVAEYQQQLALRDEQIRRLSVAAAESANRYSALMSEIGALRLAFQEIELIANRGTNDAN
jgi:hypothetical protein